MNLRAMQDLSDCHWLIRVLCLSLLCISSIVAFAQTSSVEGNGSVEGIVSNLATGDPVRGAKVYLCEAPKDVKVIPRCLPIDADSDGKFVFTGRPAGHYTVQGEAHGFLPDSIVFDGSGSREFDLAAGSVRTVHLRLWPEGTITGRIVDEEARPMPGISVAAIGERYGLGRRSFWRYQRRGPSDVLTDKDGEFRIGALKPGSYFIEAFFDFLGKRDVATVKKGYLPVYYPSAAFLSSATPVCVGAGQQVRVDFKLNPRVTYHARAKLIFPESFKRNFEPISGLSGEYGQLLTDWEEEYDHGLSTLTVTRLAPGSYELDTSTGIYPTDLTARLRFTVTDKDLDGMVLTLQEPVALQISIQLPLGFRTSTAYSLRLRLQGAGEPMDDIARSGWPITTGGQLPHPALQPGHYKLFLFTEDALYVKLISQGEDSRYVVKSTSTDRNGDFDFAGVPPGSYDAVALSEAVRDWEFGPDEWAAVKAFAKHVEVGDSTHTTFELHATTIAYKASQCIAARP